MNESKALKGSEVKVTCGEDEGLTVIDISHSKIHDGRAFAFVCEKSNLGDDDSCWIRFLTNSDKTVHFRPAMLYSSEAAVTAELWEDVTYTEGSGDSVTVFNHNRNSDITTDVSVMSDATISGGTRLPMTIIAGLEGNNQSRSGGDSSGADEYVLKPDTEYGIKVTNNGNTNTDVTIVPFWYEVDY